MPKGQTVNGYDLVPMENSPVTDTTETETEIRDRVVANQSATLVEEELLVEEISIDGMCGVY